MVRNCLQSLWDITSGCCILRMDFCEEFGEIEPLPECGTWCREMSDIHAMGCVVAPPCCDKRVSITNEIAHYLAHEVKFGDLEVKPEDMAKKLTLDMLSVKVRDSEAAAEFDQLRLKYLRQYKGGNKRVLQSTLAKGVLLQDAPMITAVCRALNKHVSIVSKHGHWSTRKKMPTFGHAMFFLSSVPIQKELHFHASWELLLWRRPTSWWQGCLCRVSTNLLWHAMCLHPEAKLTLFQFPPCQCSDAWTCPCAAHCSGWNLNPSAHQGGRKRSGAGAKCSRNCVSCSSWSSRTLWTASREIRASKWTSQVSWSAGTWCCSWISPFQCHNGIAFPACTSALHWWMTGRLNCPCPSCQQEEMCCANAVHSTRNFTTEEMHSSSFTTGCCRDARIRASTSSTVDTFTITSTVRCTWFTAIWCASVSCQRAHSNAWMGCATCNMTWTACAGQCTMLRCTPSIFTSFKKHNARFRWATSTWGRRLCTDTSCTPSSAPCWLSSTFWMSNNTSHCCSSCESKSVIFCTFCCAKLEPSSLWCSFWVRTCFSKCFQEPLTSPSCVQLQ